jgi:hypothetical protein
LELAGAAPPAIAYLRNFIFRSRARVPFLLRFSPLESEGRKKRKRRTAMTKYIDSFVITLFVTLAICGYTAIAVATLNAAVR